MGSTDQYEMPEEKKPNAWENVLLFVNKIIPMHALGSFIGLFNLLPRRIVMNRVNLYTAPYTDEEKEEENVNKELPNFRTPTGEGNDKEHYNTGASNTAFGRNMLPSKSFDPSDGPHPQIIAAKLLNRTTFKPAGDQLNILAAAWIQAMSHDWFGHIDNPNETVTLDKGTPTCPLKAFSFKKNIRRDDGFFDNVRTHWWDASFVYGQDEESVNRARTFKHGHLHQNPSIGLLARSEDEPDVTLVGDMKNGWLGVGLLQAAFVAEHNAIADAIINSHPELAGEDEKVFNYARLCVAAIAAKIHTVDWTVELLKTDTLDNGMNTNWYGIETALGLPWGNGPPGTFGLVAKDTDNHGIPFCLTEEFVAVYRLHQLLPDGLLVENDGFVPLLDVVGLKGDEKLKRDGAVDDYWNSIIEYPCGNLELFNYPTSLRDLPPTDDRGRQLIDEPIDLAAIDIYRDRERGIKKYNDFRRALYMKPFKSIADLCGNNQKNYNAVVQVYGENNIENVDLQIGMLVEKKIKGFAISETAFNIFILMASRRLQADRFFTTDFNKQTYSDVGLEWVRSVKGMRDVLKRHFPQVEAKIPKGYSAFKPYGEWPEEYVN